MDKYELVTIIDAAIPQNEKETVVKEVGDAISKCKGKVINNQVWLDKHKFTFRIKGRTEGTYYLTNMECQHNSLTKLRQSLKLNEKILRSLILKVD